LSFASERAENFLTSNKEKADEHILLPPPNDKSQMVDFGITIIIPAYNEEKRISRCLQRTIDFCNSRRWEYEIIIVEDGSTDGTVKVIRELISKNDRIKLISNKERLGKGGAITNGFSLAEKKYVGYMDADLSADPGEFDRLLPFIDQFDIVVGSRILRGGLPAIKRPFTRSFLSHCYAKLFRLLFKVEIHDPQCGFKLFRSGAANNLFAQTETRGFAFDSELLIKALTSGMTIKEVPIIWEHDSDSKVGTLREIRTMGSDLLSLWYKLKLSKRVRNWF
jgi:glycosyltransferase involved in cell wall biosynthesis